MPVLWLREQVVGIAQTFEVLAPLAAAQPEIFDVFDRDALARLAAAMRLLDRARNRRLSAAGRTG